jgi:hypothetical protein
MCYKLNHHCAPTCAIADNGLRQQQQPGSIHRKICSDILAYMPCRASVLKWCVSGAHSSTCSSTGTSPSSFSSFKPTCLFVCLVVWLRPKPGSLSLYTVLDPVFPAILSSTSVGGGSQKSPDLRETWEHHRTVSRTSEENKTAVCVCGLLYLEPCMPIIRGMKGNENVAIGSI